MNASSVLLRLVISEVWNRYLLERCVEDIIDGHLGDRRNAEYVSHYGDEMFFRVGLPFGAPQELHQFRRFDAYVIAVSEGAAADLFAKLRRTPQWNSRSKFLLVYSGSVARLVQLLSSLFVYNAVIVETSTGHVYTYYPYKYENFNEPDVEPVAVNRCYGGRLKYQSVMFEDKVPKTWRNSTVRIAVMAITPFVICTRCSTGLEMHVVELMKWYLRYGVSYPDEADEYDDWGYITDDGNYTFGIGDVHAGRADFCIGHYHLREIERLVDFDTTFHYMEDDLHWAVPKAELRSLWDNVLNIFNVVTWLSVVAVMVFLVVFWRYFAGNPVNGSVYHRSMCNSVEVAVEVALGFSILHQPKSDSVRVLFTAITIFYFIVVNCWKAYLIDSLTHDNDGYQISTLEELPESGLTIGVYPELILLHKEDGTPAGDWIGENADPGLCDASHDCLDRTAFKRDMATIETTKMFAYVIPERYKTTTGRPMLYVFEKTVIMDYTVQYYTKGHPTFQRANELLMWIKTSGFVDYFETQLYHEIALMHSRNMAKVKLFEVRKLAMEHLWWSFNCLFGGVAIASVIFLLELLLFRKVKLLSNFRRALHIFSNDKFYLE